MTEEEVKTILRNIPNSVSGDGKTFVAALKNYLTKNGVAIDDKIDDKLDSALEELAKKPAHVTNITLLELHTVRDGVRSNNIQVNWDITPVEDYAKAEVWYKTDGDWQKAGEASGTQYVMQGAETSKTYYIRVVAVNAKGNVADFDTAPQVSIKIKGSQYIPAAPTQFVLTWDEQGPLWKWLFTDNNYIDFFELRLDQNPGVWNDKRLDSTRETWSRADPGVRAGTAYLYVRNIFGEYSEPAVHQFNKAQPSKPSAPAVTSTIDGVRIKMEPLPLGSTRYRLYIKTVDGEESNEDYFETVNSEYIYFFFSGTITVRYQFVDPLGSGEWSDEVTATVKAGVDISQVPTIGYDKVTPEIKDAIDIANKQPEINKVIDNSIANINNKFIGIDSDIAGINSSITNINTDISDLQLNVIDIDSVINGLDVGSINSTLAELDKQMQSNTSGIQQNADSIAAVVTRVTTVEGEVEKQGTAINQTAESITSLAKRVTTNEGKIDANMSVIQQNADSITALVKRVTVAESGIEENTTAINQTADSITALAKRVTSNEGKISTNTSAIEQNAAGITALVTRVTTAEGNVDSLAQAVTTTATAVKQNADSITSIAKRVINTENGMEEHTSSIQQNADSIAAVVTRVSTVEGTVTAQGTAINQTAESITAVVTELNKDPDKCNYSAISQLQDNILLSVKKDEVINAINISKEGIVIDGNKIHITGDTVFDNNVIVGGAIVADSIAMEHLKVNSVSTAKIQANAITADKIMADAITADKIEAGAINAKHLAADSVGADAIQAGSIVGDKIAAGTLTADKFYSGDINLAGALAVVGGAVKLSEEGLRCSEESGGYTLFDERGITFYDKNGNQYSQLHRICIGTAKHGSIIKFTAPWMQTPKVICVPTELQCNESNYAQSDVFIVCRALNVTNNGFSLECYTKVGGDSKTTATYNKDCGETASDNVDILNSNTYQAYYGINLDVPKSATSGIVTCNLKVSSHYSERHGDHQTTISKSQRRLKVQILKGDEKIAESEFVEVPIPSVSGATNTKEQIVSVSFSISDNSVYKMQIVEYYYYNQMRLTGAPITKTLSNNLAIFLSASYDAGEFVVSTGTAAFIAIENANADYSVTEAT